MYVHARNAGGALLLAILVCTSPTTSAAPEPLLGADVGKPARSMEQCYDLGLTEVPPSVTVNVNECLPRAP